MTNTIQVRKTRIYNNGTSCIQSATFKTGYDVDFTHKDGSKGKVREFTKTEISSWLRRAVENNEVDKTFAREVRRQIKELG